MLSTFAICYWPYKAILENCGRETLRGITGTQPRLKLRFTQLQNHTPPRLRKNTPKNKQKLPNHSLLGIMKEMDDEKWIERDNLCEQFTLLIFVLWFQVKWIYLWICRLFPYIFLGDKYAVCYVSYTSLQQSIPALDCYQCPGVGDGRLSLMESSVAFLDLLVMVPATCLLHLFHY